MESLGTGRLGDWHRRAWWRDLDEGASGAASLVRRKAHTRLRGTCLCLCGGYPAAFRRGSRRITLHMVDLFGGARLGRRHMLGWRLAATGLRPSLAILGFSAPLPSGCATRPRD